MITLVSTNSSAPTTAPNSVDASQLKYPDVLWASALGLGFLPKAPGTWGSVGGLVIWWFFLSDLSVLQQLVCSLVYFVSGWWVSHTVCKRYALDDAQCIVADEVVGMWLALLLLPKLWWCGLLAFVLFRLFDVLKPGPIGWLDRQVKGGLGVMLDDVAAGICAGGCMLLIYESVLYLTS